jgi:hypothetical protein
MGPQEICSIQNFTYLGFDWDLSGKTVAIPEKKQAKYVDRLLHWTLGSTVSKKDTEKLIRTLNNAQLGVPEGRLHLPSLYRPSASFKPEPSEWTRRQVTSEVAEDMDWWRAALSCPFLQFSGSMPAF